MLNPLANSNVLALKSICSEVLSEKSVEAKKTERARVKQLDASLTHHTGSELNDEHDKGYHR